MNKEKMLIEQLHHERQQAIAEQKEDLLERAKRLGFEQVYDGVLGWIALCHPDSSWCRYQFQESAEGLGRLAGFLIEHGNYSATATNKNGDAIGLSVDHENKRFCVGYMDLVGYDSVEFHVGDEAEARTLYAALLTVEEVEAD
jgi:hypothetical protein